MKKNACPLVVFFAVVFISACPFAEAVAPQAVPEIRVGSTSESLAYEEYEKLTLKRFSETQDEIPDWRERFLLRIAEYETYLRNYPNSPLIAETKLRIAELYKEVEKPEVHEFLLERSRCLGNNVGGPVRLREACIEQFYKNIGNWRDPYYQKKAAALLIELVENYGHVKRYSWEEPRVGGFRWIEEEIGARALFILSGGADKPRRKGMLLLIQKEYAMGLELQQLVAADLEKLKGVQAAEIKIKKIIKKQK